MSNVKCLKCNACIQRRGWHGRLRRVETLKGHYVLIQEQFQCDCYEGKSKRKFSALSFLFDEKERYSGVTAAMKAKYPVHLTHKCAVDEDVMQLIVADMVSAKSADQIGDTIAAIRLNEYLQSRVAYEAEYLEYRAEVDSQNEMVERLNGEQIKAVDMAAFSTFQDRSGYNETLTIYSKAIIDVFVKFVEDRASVFLEHIEKIDPHWCISVDTTFNIAKRTRDYGLDGENPPIGDNTFTFAMNGDGQVCTYRRSVGETDEQIIELLREVKRKCDARGAPYPKYIFIDDANEHIERKIKEVFPLARVGQDAKHFVNRLVRTLNKEADQYTAFARALHGAVFLKPEQARRRDGKVGEVRGRVASFGHIKRTIENLRSTYGHFPDLFKKKVVDGRSEYLFDSQWTTCQSKLRFIIEAYKDDEMNDYYFEAEDGHFYLYRGTNKNESIHRRLNAIFPEKCGVDLSNAVIMAFVCNWNFRRALYSGTYINFYIYMLLHIHASTYTRLYASLRIHA